MPTLVVGGAEVRGLFFSHYIHQAMECSDGIILNVITYSFLE